MPGATALNRVNRYDFFAILGSGVYVVGSCGLLSAALLMQGQTNSAPAILERLSQSVESHWPLAVGVLFLAFLIGSVLRALPVNLMDNWWNSRWNIGIKALIIRSGEAAEKRAYFRALWHDSFPYGAMLELELKALKENRPDLEFRLPPAGTLHSMYNFWKAELCRENVAAFEYTQELEGRVRLFASMCWAAVIGLCAAVGGVVLCLSIPRESGWLILMLVMLVLSALICWIFGSELRRVRGQEVASVFMAYVSLTQSRVRREEAKVQH